MNGYRILAPSLLVILLIGCASVDEKTALNPDDKIVSIEEAKQLALEFSRLQYSPPSRRIDALREYYTEYRFKTDVDCKKVNQLYEERLEELYRALIPFSTRNEVAASIALFSENQFLNGRFKEALQLAITAYQKISNGPTRWERVALASSIGRMYAMTQDLLKAREWFVKANTDWNSMRKQGKNLWIETWTSRPPGQANIYAVQATLAYLENDLLAEEYYLRKILELVWDIRHSSWASVNAADLAAKLSKNLIHQNRFVEAELNALKYENLTYNFEKSPLLINAISESLLAQGRTEEAEYTARLAIKLHRNICSLNDGIPFTEARRNLIKILASKGDWEGILKLKSEIKGSLSDKSKRYQQLYGSNPDLLLAHLFTNLPGSGSIDRVLAARSLAIEQYGSDSSEALELNAVAAIVYQSMGDYDRAVKAYNRSVPVLQQQASSTISQNQRYQRFRDGYIEFLASDGGREAALKANIDPVLTSFKLANTYNLGIVQHHLAVSALKANVRDPELAISIRELQDIDHQGKNMLDLIVFLQSGQEGQVDHARIQSLNKQYSILRRAKNQLEALISDGFPAYSQLLNPEAPDVDELRGSLKPGELLLVYYVGDQESYLWSLTNEGKLELDSIDLGRQTLRQKIDTLRQALDPKVNTVGEIPPFDTKLAYELYQKLLTPITRHHEHSNTDLVVVPGNELGTLPFGLLVTEPKTGNIRDNLLFSEYRELAWLINDYSISVVPSATSLTLLRDIESAETTSQTQFIGFGDPLFQTDQNQIQTDFNQRSALALNRRSIPNTRNVLSADLSLLPPLPDTRDEINQIALILNANPATDIFIQNRATEQNVKQSNLETTNVLVFATHGLLPGDLNGLDQPALAMTNPNLLEAESKEDGLLKMEEVIGLKLNADWVILSACNTGAGNGEGAEAFSGLGQAFFYAGAKSLLLSNWPVESTSARTLTTGIFKQQQSNPKLSRAQALQQSIKNLINTDASNNLYSYAHPIFWAPFTLIGDGG